ncbi:hypothetical protein BaRGS_00028299 [Batillaria attramentaria]|uniref:SEA domain-containing protein n=1 Tax=Batillaria attramentaria TaxID=370345 RepID=A0ABD0K0K6_9CAEN
MEKSEKPKWIKNFEDTYSSPSLPGYWNKPMATGKATHDANGYRLPNGRGGFSDTSSVVSRITSSSSERAERKRARRLGLFLILVIVAFIIAALIGLLVYFLFMRDPPARYTGGGVRGSVRVLNMTYNDAMANTSSQEFRDVAEPFCQEMDKYLAASNYSDRYEGCEVVALRNVADVADCLCLGAKKGSVMVEFELRLNGSHDEDALKRQMHYIIENSVRKHKIDDVIHVLIKYFLVDIRLDWKMPYEAIEADVELPVYNLNYSSALTNNRSTEFLVDKIMKDDDVSWLTSRYRSCRVTGFTEHSTVSFTLNFEGRDPRPLQQSMIYILLSGARTVEWYNQLLKMIGTLVVTPFDYTLDLRPVNKTGPPPNVTYVSIILPVFNLTLTPELGDRRSQYFIDITTDFCNDMARFYQKSALGDKFYSCQVYGFRPHRTRIEFRIGFQGDEWPGMKDSIVTVIRAHAPDRLYGTFHLYKVGSLEVILDLLSANGLELHTSLEVVNLTFTSALEDSGSPQFLHHAVLFCRDVSG